MSNSSTELTSQAAGTVAQFINSTASHVFLTGKAGTGKTTFLKNLARKTHKNFIVVAPTGIAALNAGGVTIHSQFLFPLGMFLPERNMPNDLPDVNFFTSDMLARRHPLNSQRKQVLRAIDLLVIDEVSMLRADLLDAIDYRMKAARGNFSQRFGGVQLLLIGDLFQLPPVVARTEESLMARYYNSPWFFEAICLKDKPPVYIELDKIYRQNDEKFIALLNNLRNNLATKEDIEILNSSYKSQDEIREMKEIITLTTHNYKADELNQRALEALTTEARTFEATVEGEFPESMFPVLRTMMLKGGAQIMFVKNDIDKMYFNGKLATVLEITPDGIEVEMAESHLRYKLKRERWENKKYTLNKERQDLDEEILGTFEQYPIKLAWAITVHKSQGLTFERAIIDVGQAFADGQVYVALSRLRSLEGLVLRSHINPGVISTDKTIAEYSRRSNNPGILPDFMRQEQQHFLRNILADTFDFSLIAKEIRWFQKNSDEEVIATDMKPVPIQILEGLEAEKNNTDKFSKQLAGYLHAGSLEKLHERVEKGVAYYKNIVSNLLKLLLVHIRETQKRKRVKKYLAHLNELDQMLSKKLEDFEKALFLTKAIIHQKNDFDFSTVHQQLKENRASLVKEVNVVALQDSGNTRVRKKRSNRKGDKSTYDVTLALLESGKSPEAIANERGLVLSTIEGHLAKAVDEQRVSIFKFVSEADVLEIERAIDQLPANGFSSKDLYEMLKGKYGYGKLKAVMAHKRLIRPDN